MKLTGRKRKELVAIFTSPSTPAEHAERLADLLIAEGVENTDDIPYARWVEMLTQSRDAAHVPANLAPEGDNGPI